MVKLALKEEIDEVWAIARNEQKLLEIQKEHGERVIPISIDLSVASKAFERSYSRALNVELEGTGITSTAVCPGWIDT